MAIKRTIGRSKFVQPTGIAVDSGGQAMAQASQNIANAITNITETVDKNQLDTALLEAQSQGINIGSSTNKDGSLKPLDLLTLNSSFKTDMFNKSNQRKAEAEFKKYAINTFGLNVQNDIKKYASNSFDKNRGSFDSKQGKTVVQSQLESYANTLKGKIAPEVWNNIKPTVDSIIGDYSRQSSAEHLKNVRAKGLATANESMMNLIDEKAKYILAENIDDAGGGIPSVTNENFDKREKELFEIFSANLPNSSDVEKVKNIYKTNLQARITKDAITAAHTFGLEKSSLIQMVEAITKENENTTLNVDAIHQEGMNTINALHSISVAKKAETNAVSEDLFNEFYENIIKGKPPSVIEVDNSGMTDPHKNQINLMSQSKQVEITNKALAIEKETNEQLIFDIEYGNARVSSESTTLMQQRIKEGKSQGTETRSFIKSWLKRHLTDLKDKQSFQYSGFFAELGDNSSYTISPLVFLGQVDKLVELGVIGEKTHNKNPLMSVKAFRETVMAYAKKYNPANEARYEHKLTIKLLKGGKNGDRTTIESLEKDNLIPKTIKYKNETLPVDITHDDANIKEASLKVALKWSVDHNTIHPSLIEAFDALGTINNEKLFTDITMAYTRLNESFRINNKEQLLRLALDKVNINPNILHNARRYGMEWTNKISERNDKSVQRIYTDFKIKDETQDQFVKRQFKKFLGNQNFVKDILLTDHNLGRLYSMVSGDYGDTVKTIQERKLISDFQKQNGFNNLDEVVLNDPRIMQLLTDGFWTYATDRNQIADGEKGLLDAMGLTLQKVFNQIGITKDGNGQMRWTFDPPLKQFQSTVPVDKMTGTSIPVTLTHEDMYNHIYDTINSMEIAWNKDNGYREGHNNKNYQIVPNYNYGKEPSYTVNIVNNVGTPKTFLNNFKFNWATSRNNKAWQRAVNTIKDNGFRKFVYGIPGMERQQVTAIYNRWLENDDPDSAIRALQDIYNRAVVAVLPIGQQDDAIINLTNREAAEKNAFLRTLGLDIGLWLEN